MKKAMWSIVGLALVGLGIVFYQWFTPGRTPAIHGPNSIASLERIRIGDVEQYILIRGNDSSLPVLLFLHGGPGMPSMYLANAFQRELEEEFVVVQWDRRAAGKSYREDISSTLTTEQLVADTVNSPMYSAPGFTRTGFILWDTPGAPIWECSSLRDIQSFTTLTSGLDNSPARPLSLGFRMNTFARVQDG